MRFASIRELRNKPDRVWKGLEESGEVVITSNGRPVAMVVPVDEESVELEVRAYRQARAQLAIARMQHSAAKAGMDDLSLEEIDSLVQRTRSRDASDS